MLELVYDSVVETNNDMKRKVWLLRESAGVDQNVTYLDGSHLR